MFHTSMTAQSDPIQLATNSPYSHVGIVYLDERGSPRVFEAIGPVLLTPWDDWVKRGKNGHALVMRLEDRASLSDQNIEHMQGVGREFLGKPYDGKFQWTDDRIYCSELVWKTYKRGADIELCPTSTASDLDLSDPEIQRLLKVRYGQEPIDMNEILVTPADLANCPMLREVHRIGEPL